MPAKRNSYYYFVMSFQDEQKLKNITFKSFEDASKMACGVWSAMSKEEKDKFALKNLPASTLNNPKNPGIEKKYTSQGKLLVDVEKEKRTLISLQKRMKSYIEDCVNTAKENSSLHEQQFFFIHSNYYCEVNGEYHHAELAISKFNLENGVQDLFHTFIYPGSLPMGTTGPAIHLSEREHRIPLPSSSRINDLSPTEDNYYELYTRVRTFLVQGIDERGKCILYTLQKYHKQTENLLVQLYNESGMGGIFSDYFALYDLNTLFYQIGHVSRIIAGLSGYETTSVPKYITEKDEHDAWTSIACKFHVNEDAAPYCSLSIVTRLAFYICQDCAGYLGVKLEKGKHFPREVPVREIIRPSRPLHIPEPKAPVAPPPIVNAWGNVSATSVEGAVGCMPHSSPTQGFRPIECFKNTDLEFPVLGRASSGKKFTPTRPHVRGAARGGRSALPKAVDTLKTLSSDSEDENLYPHDDPDYKDLKKDNDPDISLDDLDRMVNQGSTYHQDTFETVVTRGRVMPSVRRGWPSNVPIGHLSRTRLAANFSTPFEHQENKEK